MALARKGSRQIVVGGIAYRWKVRGRPTYAQALVERPLTFVVEQAERAGALLVASLPCAHPSNWFHMSAGVVLPRTVASAIELALAEGWQPSCPGPAFQLALDESAVSLRFWPS